MKIVDLDQVVPEDTCLRYRGREYVIPGDTDGETLIRLLKVFQAVGGLEEEAGNPDALGKALHDAEAELVRVFNLHRKRIPWWRRWREPKVKAPLPFGTLGFQHVLRHVLESLGLTFQAATQGNVEPGEAEASPTPVTKTSP